MRDASRESSGAERRADAIEITAIRLEEGDRHEHITGVMWRCQATSVGLTSRHALIDWLGESNDNQAVVADAAGWVQVAVVRRPYHPPYLRTRMDGAWTDHLLSLPSF